MSRRISLLRPLRSLVLIACACSAAPPSSGPPGSAGGGSNGGADSQGGSTSNTGVSAGGSATNTGGVANNTVGGGAATGGAPVTGAGGAPAATGGTPSSTPAVTVVMSLTNLSSDTLQGNLTVTLPAGAAPIAMSTLMLTLCGAGGGGTAQASAMQIYDGRLTCPQTQSTNSVCPIGQSNSFQSQVKVTVTGAGPSCCFNFDFSSVPNSLAPGGQITLNYAQDITKGNTLSHQSPQVWSAIVSGQPAAGSCTIAGSASTVTCG